MPPRSSLPGGDDASEPAFLAKEASDGAWAAQLDGLLRLPWRIEVWAEWTRPAGSFSGPGGTVVGVSTLTSLAAIGVPVPAHERPGRSFSGDIDGIDLRIVGSVSGSSALARGERGGGGGQAGSVTKDGTAGGGGGGAVGTFSSSYDTSVGGSLTNADRADGDANNWRRGNDVDGPSSSTRHHPGSSTSASSSSPYPAGASSASAQARQVVSMRMEVPVDAFVDLSAFSREVDAADPDGPGAVPTGAEASTDVSNSSGRAQQQQQSKRRSTRAPHSPPNPCDGFIKGVCIDSQGSPAPFALPPHAKIRAALFCGVHAVSQLGEIPLSALQRSAGTGADDGSGGHSDVIRRTVSGSSLASGIATGTGYHTPSSHTAQSSAAAAHSSATSAVYADTDSLLLQLANTSGWDDPPASVQAAAATAAKGAGSSSNSGAQPYRRTNGGGDDHGYGHRSRSRATRGRTEAELDSIIEDLVEQQQQQQQQAGGGGRRGRGAAAYMASQSPLGLDELEYGDLNEGAVGGGEGRGRGGRSDVDFEPLGMAIPRDEHDTIEDAPQRLRRRNAAALGCLALPTSKRHANAWALDAGLLEVDGPLPQAAAATTTTGGNSGGSGVAAPPVTEVLSITGGPAGTQLAGTCALADLVSGGPEATTTVVSGTVVDTHAPAQVVESLVRTGAERHAYWHGCDVDEATAEGPGADGGDQYATDSDVSVRSVSQLMLPTPVGFTPTSAAVTSAPAGTGLRPSRSSADLPAAEESAASAAAAAPPAPIPPRRALRQPPAVTVAAPTAQAGNNNNNSGTGTSALAGAVGAAVGVGAKHSVISREPSSVFAAGGRAEAFSGSAAAADGASFQYANSMPQPSGGASGSGAASNTRRRGSAAGPSLPALSGDVRFSRCPPGSPVRFNFIVNGLSGSPQLESVEFGFALLPRLPHSSPLRPTLYECLAATRRGASLLEKAGHVDALLAVAFGPAAVSGRECTATHEDASDAEDDEGEVAEGVLLQRRAALLALAQIGSSLHGYTAVLRRCHDFTLRVDAAARGLCLQRDITSTITPASAHSASGRSDATDRSPWHELRAVPHPHDDVALRQTATLCLALLARHARGFDDVTVLGWIASPPAAPPDGLTATSLPSLVVVPQLPVTAYTLVTPSTSSSNSASAPSAVFADDLSLERSFLYEPRLPPRKPEWEGILSKVCELASRISQRDARSFLLRRKNEAPEVFASSGLYAHVHALLSRYTMSLPVRRFVHALFDRVSFSDKAWEGICEVPSSPPAAPQQA